MSLTRRVFAGLLAIVVVLVVLIVALADRRLQASLVDDAVAELAREARVVAAQWRPGMDADSLADEVGRLLEHRVTLIDSTGVVTGDSEFEPPAVRRLENHGTRPEVVASRTRPFGWSRRASPSAGDEELYVAVRAPLGYARLSMTMRALAAITGGAQRDVLGAAAIAVLVAIGLTLLFARSVSRPIVALRDVARSLAAGDLTRRPALSAAGEVGDLSAALGRMAEQLELRLGSLEADDALMTAMLESLHEGVVAVDSDGQVVRANPSAKRLLHLPDTVPFAATELPRERMLRDALDAALGGRATEPIEGPVNGRTLAVTARPLAGGGAVLALLDLTPFRRLEEVRRDFVANVSHELRTPLTVINGFADTLAEDDTLEPQPRNFAGMIRSNARRMQAIVDDLLDLSRIESGGWTPAPMVNDVASAARDAVASVRDRAERSGVALRFELDDAPGVYADHTALRQVIGNLVSNAIRHTAAGSVTIFARPVGNGVEVGVRDTGSGIPAEHLPRIFERFYRVDRGRARDEGGTGLGLAIVRHLVEAHGGHVVAESTVGQGTTVTAFFPTAADVIPSAARDLPSAVS